MRKVTVPFFISHQGCSHTCVFCDQRAISGSAGDIPAAEDILSKIEVWRRTAGERPLEVAFFGGSFTAMPVAVQEQLLQPLQGLLASGEIMSVRISTRPDCIDDETVRRLSQSGITTIELGVQSMDDEVLERSVDPRVMERLLANLDTGFLDQLPYRIPRPILVGKDVN